MSLRAWVELVTTIIMSDQNVSAETKEKLGGVAYGLLEEIESGLTPRAADDCPQGGSHVYKWDGTLPTEEMVECEKCGHRR